MNLNINYNKRVFMFLELLID